jgi:NADH:ubiquinone oxidoreductase subunit E
LQLNKIKASGRANGRALRSREVERMREFKEATYQKLLKRSGGVTAENLFMLLGKVQDAFGHVPRRVVSDLAARTGISEARIYGALTSYRDFKVRVEADG